MDRYDYIMWVGTLEGIVRELAVEVFWSIDWDWYERFQLEQWDGFVWSPE
ncbi:hypothetical protein [Timonella senegalensis]|nr:hypothetical protein [Timonella senegalensis]